MGNVAAHNFATNNGYGIAIPTQQKHVRSVSHTPHSGGKLIYGDPIPTGAGPYTNWAHLRRPVIGSTEATVRTGGSFIPY
jgi:hypothetical protein